MLETRKNAIHHPSISYFQLNCQSLERGIYSPYASDLTGIMLGAHQLQVLPQLGQSQAQRQQEQGLAQLE